MTRSGVAVQSLKLLADILMARQNVRVMFEYVKSKRHLMLVMNLLRSSSRSIQHEAFHVFKVFVANPRKPEDIKSILVSNRDKLLRFLKHFLDERGTSTPACGPLPPFSFPMPLLVLVPTCDRVRPRATPVRTRRLPLMAVQVRPPSRVMCRNVPTSAGLIPCS